MALPIVTLDQSDVAFFQSIEHNSIAGRRLIERIILRKAIEAMIAAGYHVSVDNGEDSTPTMRDRDAILAACMATDEDTLYVYHEARGTDNLRAAAGFAQFVYGNDGYDVISNSTVKLDEEVLGPVNQFARSIEEGAMYVIPDCLPQFEVDGQRYNLTDMLLANKDDPEFCTWAVAAKDGDGFRGMAGQCLCVANQTDEARRIVSELVQWVDRTGVTQNPLLAGMDTKALDAARKFAAGFDGAKLER